MVQKYLLPRSCELPAHYWGMSLWALGSTDSQPWAHKAQPEAGTCVDELHVSLQVPVNHEHLVAAGVWAGPFPHLLMVLLNVLLGEEGARDPAV